MIKINRKTHGRNICRFGKNKETEEGCKFSFNFSPKNRTCYCAIIEERTKCVTECDDFKVGGK